MVILIFGPFYKSPYDQWAHNHSQNASSLLSASSNPSKGPLEAAFKLVRQCWEKRRSLLVKLGILKFLFLFLRILVVTWWKSIINNSFMIRETSIPKEKKCCTQLFWSKKIPVWKKWRKLGNSKFKFLIRQINAEIKKQNFWEDLKILDYVSIECWQILNTE